MSEGEEARESRARQRVSFDTLYDPELVADVVRAYLSLTQVERVVFDEMVLQACESFRDQIQMVAEPKGDGGNGTEQ